MFQDNDQQMEEQLQHRVSELLAQRFSSLAAEVQRLQFSLNEACARLLEQTQATATAEEVAGLHAHFRESLQAAAAASERDFRAQLEQARAEAAAAARSEAEAQINELQEQLRELGEQLEVSRQAPAADTAPLTAAPPESNLEQLKAAIEEIDAQRTQSDTLTAFVHHAAQFAPRIVFFVIKSGSAMGWKAGGFTNGLNDEAVRSLLVPMQADTLLRPALEYQRTAVGGPDSHPENGTILGHYGTPAAECAVAVPLVVRGKAAAVLYADSGPEPGGTIQLQALEALMQVTSMAIELLPVRRSTEQARAAAPAAQVAPAPPPSVPAPQPAVFYGGMGEEQAARVEPAFPVESAQPAFAQAAPATRPATDERQETAAASAAGAAAAEAPPAATSAAATNEAEVRAHNDARRFARLLVSEIKLYNEAKVAEGRRSFDLYERLKDDIDRSRQMYEKRVPPSVAAKFDYFYDELVHTLGEGDPQKLGRGCPGPTVPV